MQAVRPVLRGIISRPAGLVARPYHDANHRDATMDDLPVPQGDWQDDYDRKNRKYNLILATGVAMLVGTISIVKTAGLIHLNMSPPKSYE